MKPTIKLYGEKQAILIFGQLALNMQKKILLQTLRSSSREMLASAKQHVPKRSGKLKRMLKIVKFRKVDTPSEVAIAIKHVFAISKGGKINEYYGKFIHEGTAQRKTKKNIVAKINGRATFLGQNRGAIKANPYLERAYSEKADNTIAVFGSELDKNISKFISKNFKPVSHG